MKKRSKTYSIKRLPSLEGEYIYTLYDKDENVLYIGSTTNIYTRVHTHCREKWWGSFIHKVSLIRLCRDEERFSLEYFLIQQQKPIFNILGSVADHSHAIELYKKKIFDRSISITLENSIMFPISQAIHKKQRRKNSTVKNRKKPAANVETVKEIKARIEAVTGKPIDYYKTRRKACANVPFVDYARDKDKYFICVFKFTYKPQEIIYFSILEDAIAYRDQLLSSETLY